MMEIMTRKQAAEDGKTKYYTGRTCIKGHNSPRYVAGGNCCACASLRGRYYKDKIRAARFGEHAPLMVELKALVHKEDLPGLQQHVDAVAAARRMVSPVVPCRKPCAAPSCAMLDKGLCTNCTVCHNHVEPSSAPPAPGACPHGVPPNEVCNTCDVGG